MGRVTYVRYLRHEDARAIARLERRAYPRDQRNGRREIAADLREAELDGTNLSVGVFEGTRLTGCILAFLRKDRPALFEEFEVRLDTASDLDGACIYVEDIIVRPGFRRCAFLMNAKWQRELTLHAAGLPMDAFCTPEVRERWKAHGRLFSRKGLALDREMKVRDLTGKQDWYWMSWRPAADGLPPEQSSEQLPGRPGKRLEQAALPPGYEARLMNTAAEWARVREVWDELVDKMPEASGFLGYDFLSTWWRHNGMSRHLVLLGLYRDGRAVGFAPLMLAPKRILGVYRWRLEFIGDQVNMERPDLVVDPDEPDARRLLWRAAMSTASKWDAAYLREQTKRPADHPVAQEIDGQRFSLSRSTGMDSPHVVVSKDWDGYLATRSRTLRKGYRRKLRQLERLGEFRYAGYDGLQNGDDCLNAYLDVESRSWKRAGKVGIGNNRFRLAFYRALVASLAPSGRIRFRFLTIDDKAIAATFGVFQRGRFASLEICHDQAYDRYSPGVVLTGLELEECHQSGAYTDYDFLIGTYNNKTTWGTDAHRAWHLYILPRTPWGWLNRWLIFTVKPAVNRLIERFDLRDTVDRWRGRIEGYLR